MTGRRGQNSPVLAFLFLSYCVLFCFFRGLATLLPAAKNYYHKPTLTLRCFPFLLDIIYMSKNTDLFFSAQEGKQTYSNVPFVVFNEYTSPEILSLLVFGSEPCTARSNRCQNF